ncbi:hypothetical protein G7Y89_g10817 [Cudoniella acicularis]|uniref:Heterokaryon incompatibility domain-containing protein n=1 Tax=Cudoniella acicularis TaxID=354080 RepID=A0A8H4RER0_9HELO|nr:hypothetical protein G7Y89_g10817 [Cudoniella acicularis]
MWLINTTTLARSAVIDSESCTYAILSHTWADGEVTFQEFAQLSHARTKPGFSKIEQTCQLARERGIEYAWVDTCCIDKSSSAELSEAINSMFRWYKNSAACFVFLSDLPDAIVKREMRNSLPNCRWFARGWTLQELIASNDIEFYDRRWIYIGDKVSLQAQLSQITGIDIEVLENNDVLPSIPVARRMSWAAKRSTTRVEDLAYCLFGLFDVNLPMLYGEGSKAFLRLQEAIAQENNDLSLLAWTSNETKGHGQDFQGALAPSPAHFSHCGSLQNLVDPGTPRADFTITNRGFHITTRLGQSGNEYLLFLNCVPTKATDAIIAIQLVRTAYSYVRRWTDVYYATSGGLFPLTEVTPVYIPKVISQPEPLALKAKLTRRFDLQIKNESDFQFDVRKRPEHLWDSLTNRFITDGYEKIMGLLEIDIRSSEILVGPPLVQGYGQQPGYGQHPGYSQYPGYSQQPGYGYGLNRNYPPMVEETFVFNSSYVAVFGLDTYRCVKERGIIDTLVEPWTAVYQLKDDKQISDILSEEKSHGLAYVLAQLRKVLNSRAAARSLPGALTITPVWTIDTPDGRPPADFMGSGQFSSKSNYQLIFSGRVKEREEFGPASGMYDLVLSFAETG